MKRLRITGGPTPERVEIHLINEDGNQTLVDNVVNARISANAKSPMVIATLEFTNVELDLLADCEDIE